MLARDGVWIVIAVSAFSIGAILADSSGRDECASMIKASNAALEKSNAALDQAIVALRESADSIRIATDALGGSDVGPAADEVRAWRIEDLSPAELDALGTVNIATDSVTTDALIDQDATVESDAITLIEALEAATNAIGSPGNL